MVVLRDIRAAAAVLDRKDIRVRDPNPVLSLARNLARMMDPAEAMEVPRDTRAVEAVRKDTRETVRTPRDTRGPAVVPREAARDLMMATLEVAMEEVMAVEMAEDLVSITEAGS